MSKRTSGITVRTLTVALLLATVAWLARADVTTWTSVSGAQVEARYVGMERDQVILQPAEGDEVVIRINFLIPEDQVRARELHAAGAPQADDDEDDDDDGARLPTLASGPGEGHHAYYQHAHFDAWVTRSGLLYIHPKENGQRVGNSFHVRPRAAEMISGRPSARVEAFEEHGPAVQQPQLIAFAARARRDEVELTYTVEYTFSGNRICVAVEITNPRRLERNFATRTSFRFGRVKEVPAEMPQAERVKLLEGLVLRHRSQAGRGWQEENFYDTISLRGRVDRAEVSGPWGGRVITFDGENRRDGNRTHMWNYSGRPLNDGYRFLHQVDLGQRAGRVCVTID